MRKVQKDALKLGNSEPGSPGSPSKQRAHAHLFFEALKVRDEALAYAKGVQGQLLAQYDIQRAEALQEGLASHALEEEEEGDEGAAGAE